VDAFRTHGMSSTKPDVAHDLNLKLIHTNTQFLYLSVSDYIKTIEFILKYAIYI
jgi:hypothetical protein